MGHKGYGTKWVGIGVDGQEVVSDELHVVPEGERGFYCGLCEKHLQNVQAMKNHVKSGEHVERKKTAEVEALANIR